MDTAISEAQALDDADAFDRDFGAFAPSRSEEAEAEETDLPPNMDPEMVPALQWLEKAASQLRQGHSKAAIEYGADALNSIAAISGVNGGGWY